MGKRNSLSCQRSKSLLRQPLHRTIPPTVQVRVKSDGAFLVPLSSTEKRAEALAASARFLCLSKTFNCPYHLNNRASCSPKIICMYCPKTEKSNVLREIPLIFYVVSAPGSVVLRFPERAELLSLPFPLQIVRAVFRFRFALGHAQHPQAPADSPQDRKNLCGAHHCNWPAAFPVWRSFDRVRPCRRLSPVSLPFPDPQIVLNG